MVYIYKKTIGNKIYYYLRISERKGKKVLVKDIAYLGSSITDVKKNLNSLKPYKDKIRKAYRSINLFLESNYYLEKANENKPKKDDFLGDKYILIEACKLHYTNHFLKLDETTKKEIWKNFIIEFAFNTTSIEGNTINLQEAKELLDNGLTPKNKTMREIYDLQNTEKVFFWLLDYHEELSHDLIIKIHSNLMENIDARKGYRNMEVRVIKSNFNATPAPYVKTDMNLLLEWYTQNKTKLHPLVLAGAFHHKFERIHPFMDGNGRTGRMLLNYIILSNMYPPFIIHKKTRKEYLECLRTADKTALEQLNKKDYSELINFLADELSESYWNLFL